MNITLLKTSPFFRGRKNMKTAIIKVISMMVIFVAVQAYAADDSFDQYSGSCPGYLIADRLLDKMELHFTSKSVCDVKAVGGLRWMRTISRDGTWYASVTLAVGNNRVWGVIIPEVYSIKWKLRVYDATTRRVVSVVDGPKCYFGFPDWGWQCEVGGRTVYKGLSLEGFTYTMTAWFTGVRGRMYIAEVVMDVYAWPVPPGFSSHKVVGYSFTYGYAGFPRSPEE